MTAAAQSNERHSPHTSPRFARRSTTPSLLAVQNDLYAAGNLPALSLALSSSYISGTPTAPTLNTLNNSAASVATCTSAAQKSTNRMSAPLPSSTIPNNNTNTNTNVNTNTTNTNVNANANATYAVLLNLQDNNNSSSNCSTETAPPLPPRKSSPGVNDASFPPTTTQLSNGVMNKIYGCALPTQTSSKSVDNITAALDVPQTTAPPVPTTITPTAGANTPQRSLLDEDIEVGPAETIMGVIDTRPLEARLASVRERNNVLDLTSCVSLIDCFTTAPHYTHLCTALSEQPKQTNLSTVTSIPTPTPTPTPTTTSTSISTTIAATGTGTGTSIGTGTGNQTSQLLYENVTINQKDCNSVPYENINLEYITRLMSEGYSKENAITALGISRNNIEMACDILREFVSKSSV